MHAFNRPATLADRLAAGEAMTLLDVRAQSDLAIEAPSATSPHVPAGEVLDGAGDLESGGDSCSSN